MRPAMPDESVAAWRFRRGSWHSSQIPPPWPREAGRAVAGAEVPPAHAVCLELPGAHSIRAPTENDWRQVVQVPGYFAVIDIWDSWSTCAGGSPRIGADPSPLVLPAAALLPDQYSHSSQECKKKERYCYRGVMALPPTMSPGQSALRHLAQLPVQAGGADLELAPDPPAPPPEPHESGQRDQRDREQSQQQ